MDSKIAETIAEMDDVFETSVYEPVGEKLSDFEHIGIEASRHILREPTLSQRVYLPFKRLFDIVFSLIALIAFLPVFIIVAILIKIDSPGPAIFKQIRAGKGGMPFTVYKFRTMTVGADEQRLKCEKFKNETGPIRVTKGDSRITRLGKFLRNSTIDELPQLMNILLGQMSIVGPRPFAMYEHERLSEYQKKRTLVKPCLTCYWQVNGRHLVDNDTRIEMDIQYTQENGFLIDMVLVLKTIPAVIRGKGAY